MQTTGDASQPGAPPPSVRPAPDVIMQRVAALMGGGFGRSGVLDRVVAAAWWICGFSLQGTSRPENGVVLPRTFVIIQSEWLG